LNATDRHRRARPHPARSLRRSRRGRWRSARIFLWASASSSAGRCARVARARTARSESWGDAGLRRRYGIALTSAIASRSSAARTPTDERLRRQPAYTLGARRPGRSHIQVSYWRYFDGPPRSEPLFHFSPLTHCDEPAIFRASAVWPPREHICPGTRRAASAGAGGYCRCCACNARAGRHRARVETAAGAIPLGRRESITEFAIPRRILLAVQMRCPSPTSRNIDEGCASGERRRRANIPRIRASRQDGRQDLDQSAGQPRRRGMWWRPEQISWSFSAWRCCR